MEFKLTINTDNAAFSPEDGNGLAEELSACLQGVIDRLNTTGHSGGIYDSNGNRVGSFELIDSEES